MNQPMMGNALPRPTGVTPPAPLPAQPPAQAGAQEMHPADLQAILQLLMMLFQGGGQGQPGMPQPALPAPAPMAAPAPAAPPAGMAAMMPGLMGGR